MFLICMKFIVRSSWSFSAATGMRWIKAKMEELGVTKNTEYKLTFMLDDLAMITVHAPRYGVIDVGKRYVNFHNHKKYVMYNIYKIKVANIILTTA